MAAQAARIAYQPAPTGAQPDSGESMLGTVAFTERGSRSIWKAWDFAATP